MADFSARNLSLVLRREYQVRVHSRSFILSTIATPLLLGLIVALPMLLSALAGPVAQGPGAARGRVVIVCGDSIVEHFLRRQFAGNPSTAYQIEIDPDTSADERRRLDAELRVSAIAAYVRLDPNAIVQGGGDYYGPGTGSHHLYLYIRGNITMALARARLWARGLPQPEIDRALRPMDLRFYPSGAGSSLADVISGYAGYILAYVLFFTLVGYGTMLMQSVIEEKMSRTAELLLLSTSPEEMIAGKILGVGSAGLTQLAVWLVLAAAVAMMFPGARQTLATVHIGAGAVILFIAFYLLGYLLYSTLFAIVGVAAEGSRAPSQWTLAVMLPLLIAMLLLPMVSAAPQSTGTVIASMIPYFAPVLMWARIALSPPPAWQIALCLTLLAGTIAISWIACARIYRVGILMYGKQLSLKEVIRWVRDA